MTNHTNHELKKNYAGKGHKNEKIFTDKNGLIILEKDKDKLMERTSVRPLPQNKLSVFQAFVFATLIGFTGLFLLNQINPEGSFYGIMSKSSFFGLISILLYVLSYTPLKRVSTISIFVGAIIDGV